LERPEFLSIILQGVSTRDVAVTLIREASREDH